MKKHITLIILVTLLVMCGRVFAQDNKTEEAPADSTMTAEELSEFSREQVEYDSGSKRDPFGSLVPKQAEEGQKIKGLLNFEKAKLSGVVNADDDKYALVIDADGFGHVLREGYMVYGGYVTAITDDSVHLHIVKYGRAMSIVLSFETSKSTIIGSEEEGNVVKKPGINITYDQSFQQQKSIVLEDIVIPSLGMKTLEERWFGTSVSLPETDDTKEEAANNVQSFSLFDPPHDSWIKTPYELNWTNYTGNDINYILIVDDDSEFNPPHIVLEQVRESSYLIVDDMQLPANKQLFWKVVAVDGEGVKHESRQQLMTFKVEGNK
ncbi:hypothetical protein ACFL47_10300 [Candidatus Latescibacterota bacterium]